MTLQTINYAMMANATVEELDELSPAFPLEMPLEKEEEREDETVGEPPIEDEE